MLKSILLLESNVSVQNNIKAILEIHGYSVLHFNKGADLFDYLNENDIDLILCDVILPDMNGIDVYKRLKNEYKHFQGLFVFLFEKNDITELKKNIFPTISNSTKKLHTATAVPDFIKLKNESKGIKLYKDGNNDKEICISAEQFNYDDVIVIPDQNEYTTINVSTITFIKADDVYSEVYTNDNKKFYIRKLLKEWEKILPSRYFRRIHRSTLINVKRIDRIEKWSNYSLVVFMDGYNDTFVVSRKYLKEFRESYFI